MADEGQLSQIARERAAKLMDTAAAVLIEQADKIAAHYGIPHGINGLTRGEMLGRTAFVASMQRQLRVAAEQYLAGDIIREQTSAPVFNQSPEINKDPPPPVVLPKKPIVVAPTTPAPAIVDDTPKSDTLDLGELPGITAQTIKALKGSGYHRVCDIVNVPDEHLLAVQGIADKSLGQLRAAVAAYLA